MQKKIESLLKRLAIKYNKPFYVIYEIYMSEFRKTHEEINTMNQKTIKLPNWGKSIVSKSKSLRIDYTAKRKRN
jgi:hypothetical protein